MQRFKQYGENRKLREVIIGRAEGYLRNEAYVELVNEDQKKGLPTAQELSQEFENFRQLLQDHGVKVHIPDYVGSFVYDQLTPRDIGMCIGDKFLICNMKRSSRRYEVAGIFSILNKQEDEGQTILIPPSNDILLEGGDIMLDKGRILIGISQRSNLQGFEYLSSQFADEFEVVALRCMTLAEGENILHLDCTFNPVGTDHALIYPEGFAEIPDFIQREYKWIEVRKEEQAALATNVLSLDEKTVISRDHPDCHRVNEEMRKIGLTVHTLKFDAAPSTGGSFRCCSLPLVRD